MRGQVAGLMRGSYLQDDGDCILDCYQNGNGINLVFVNLDLDVYYHWFMSPNWEGGERLKVGSPFQALTPDPKWDRDEISGLRAGTFNGDGGKCKLVVSMTDWGIRLRHEDHQMEQYYQWIVEANQVISFKMGCTPDLTK